MYVFCNPNPKGSYVGDCVIRALSIITGHSWDDTYLKLCAKGYLLCDMPSSNRVWGEFLKECKYHRFIIPDTCPDCYTIKDFCNEHPVGSFILGTGTHVVAIIDGDYYDSWDSGNEYPVYYWFKEE